MSKIISIHSFRGGTGKSNIVANLAYLLFSQGKRIGIIDSDIASPGIHILFGIDETKIQHTLNDYLWNRCSIQQAALDVSESLTPNSDKSKLFIIPSSLNASEITKVLREGYDVEKLIQGFHQIVEKLQLDYLFIDTHPGINEETLLSISISDTLIVVMRPDSQDYQGTAIAIELAKKLDVPRLFIVVNKTLPEMNLLSIQKQLEQTYDTPVAAILPFSIEMMVLGSSELFTRKYPEAKITQILKDLANTL